MNPEELRAELKRAIDLWHDAIAAKDMARIEFYSADDRKAIAERKLSAVRGLLDAYEIDRMDIEKEHNP